MNPKYQVFVSSTYVDLKDERDLVIKAVLEMGHIPVGMEMFSAADEEQWGIIKKQIDQSDYYVVVVAHRYGSVDADGLSYTEKEYNYASSIGVPILGFVIDNESPWPIDKSELGESSISSLESFKSKIKLKPVSFWKSKEDLYGKCSIALMKAFSAYPREGWVRASLATNGSMANEVLRLSAENSDLRGRIALLEENESQEKSLDKLIGTLKANKKSLSYMKVGGTDWQNGPKLTHFQIYESVAPELLAERNTQYLSKFLAQVLCNVPVGELRSSWPSPRNLISDVLADFSALGCVAPSEKKKPVSDTSEYWTLTKTGHELLGYMRRRRLERVEQSVKVVPAIKLPSDVPASTLQND